MEAICFAAIAGFHGPGSSAAITFNLVVAIIKACENDTDSCWLSAPYPAMKRICDKAYSKPMRSAVFAYRTLLL